LTIAHDRREAVNRTTEAIERDLAALIKRANDLLRGSAELRRAAKELQLKAAHLNGVLAKQKRPYLQECFADQGEDETKAALVNQERAERLAVFPCLRQGIHVSLHLGNSLPLNVN
jgi:hypothetical protein